MKINGKHPFWGIVRMAVFFIGLTAFLWMNSETFDRTEVTTIIELLVLASGFEAVKHKLESSRPKSD